jgi:hypothetical protein
VFEKNMFKTKAVTPLWFGKTCLITSGHTARVENKTCKKKSGHTAEVLVFEKNMFKTKAVTPLWFGFGKKHVERTNNHPRKIFFWYKRMHQNKKRPHRYVFLSHQNKGRNKKRTHRYTCDQKNSQQSQKKTRAHSFCRPPISQSLGCRFLQHLSNSSGFLDLGLARSCLVMVATSLPAAAHRIP